MTNISLVSKDALLKKLFNWKISMGIVSRKSSLIKLEHVLASCGEK